MSTEQFIAAGLAPPKRTFLDLGHRGASAGGSSSGRTPVAPGSKSGSSSHHVASLVAPAAVPPPDTKSVVLAENRIEILDMLAESVATLRNVYRSKFVLGDHLRLVDPSYSGDSTNRFDLSVPPPFDPAYGLQAAAGAAEDDAPAATGTGAQGGDTASKEKLRVAEELIKKLFRRNTQLETDNKYLKAEIVKLERMQGLSREQSHNLSIEDGHIPLNHPSYTKKMVRRCRSIPPQRTMLRSAVNGFGLSFPPRPGSKEHEDALHASHDDPLPVVQLKSRILQLTEALVVVQHDNEQLVKERSERLSMRDSLLRQYLAEHDAQVARLNRLLQDLIVKVQNPLKLMRAKQPAFDLNPVVVAQNILREVSQALSDQVQAVTCDIVRDTLTAMPPPGPIGGPSSSASRPAAISSPTRGANAVGRHAASGSGGAVAMLEAAALTTDDSTAVEGLGRRKDLARRLRSLAEQLPVPKRKQLLLLLTELKELYVALCRSNGSLLDHVEQSRERFSADLIRLKMEGALLRDALRACGLDDKAVIDAGTKSS